MRPYSQVLRIHDFQKKIYALIETVYRSTKKKRVRKRTFWGKKRVKTRYRCCLREYSSEISDALGHAYGDCPAKAVANNFHAEKVGGIYVGFCSLGEFTESSDECKGIRIIITGE